MANASSTQSVTTPATSSTTKLPNYSCTLGDGEFTFHFDRGEMHKLETIVLQAYAAVGVIADNVEPGSWEAINASEQSEILSELYHHLGRTTGFTFE